MDQKQLQSIIESILFVNGEPISLGKLAKVTGATNEQLLEAMRALEARYAQPESGLLLLTHGEQYQLATRTENAQVVEQLAKSELQDTLSQAALEVISIIAYRGPISKPEIEAIRGVNCNYTVRNLLLRGLIERSDNPRDSRGYVYSITFDLLKKLGIDDVKKLPDYDTLTSDERIASLIANE